MLTLEPGIAWFLALLDTAEEVLEGCIQILESCLQRCGVYFL